MSPAPRRRAATRRAHPTTGVQPRAGRQRPPGTGSPADCFAQLDQGQRPAARRGRASAAARRARSSLPAASTRLPARALAPPLSRHAPGAPARPAPRRLLIGAAEQPVEQRRTPARPGPHTSTCRGPAHRRPDRRTRQAVAAGLQLTWLSPSIDPQVAKWSRPTDRQAPACPHADLGDLGRPHGGVARASCRRRTIALASGATIRCRIVRVRTRRVLPGRSTTAAGGGRPRPARDSPIGGERVDRGLEIRRVGHVSSSAHASPARPRDFDKS